MKVSFLNKFFIFKKIRDVDAEAVEKIQLNLNKDQQKEVGETNKELDEVYNSGPKLLKEPINYIKSGGKRLRPSLCLLISNIFKVNKLR